MFRLDNLREVTNVAPFTGAWIEILETIPGTWPRLVAPFTGAWIEILIAICLCRSCSGRSLHGSVD